MIRVPLRALTDAVIAAEWDAAAPIRVRQISNGLDFSATRLLAPAIVSLLQLPADSPVQSLIDIGCGVGWLSRRLTRVARKVSGVDPSASSIKLARSRFGHPRVSFECSTVQQLRRAAPPGAFDAAVANMTLSVVPRLDGALKAVSYLLGPGGRFVFTIPHPCFWPVYWGYADEPWFDYRRTIAIRAQFRIRKEQTTASTTHIHRPLACYLNALTANRFMIESMHEVVGPGFKWPRFLAVRTLKRKDA